jgi:hypothetical protein
VPCFGYGRRLCLREAVVYADSRERGQTNDNRCRESGGCIGEELVRLRVRSSQYTSASANRAVYRTTGTLVPIIWLAGRRVAAPSSNSGRVWSRSFFSQVEQNQRRASRGGRYQYPSRTGMRRRQLFGDLFCLETNPSHRTRHAKSIPWGAKVNFTSP